MVNQRAQSSSGNAEVDKNDMAFGSLGTLGWLKSNFEMGEKGGMMLGVWVLKLWGQRLLELVLKKPPAASGVSGKLGGWMDKGAGGAGARDMKEPTLFPSTITHTLARVSTFRPSWWLSAKEPTYQCRRLRRHGFNLWGRKVPWKRQWQPTPVFLSGKSHGQRSLVGYSP